MKYEEAMKKFIEMSFDSDEDKPEENSDLYVTAYTAIAHLIPTEPIMSESTPLEKWKDKTAVIQCPRCHKRLRAKKTVDFYCSRCGQAIDWNKYEGWFK